WVCTAIDPVSAHPRESGDPEPRSRPRAGSPLRRGRAELRGRFKFSSSRTSATLSHIEYQDILDLQPGRMSVSPSGSLKKAIRPGTSHASSELWRCPHARGHSLKESLLRPVSDHINQKQAKRSAQR